MTRSGRPGRMGGDAAWNFAAFGVTAAVGAAVTFMIAGWKGAAALGVFAQLYAVHAIGAQIAVFGAHDSVQKHSAVLADQGEPDDDLVRGALQLVLFTGGLLAAVLVALAAPISRLVESEAVRPGLYWVAPGIVFFALNKVLFGVLNGRGSLRLYAWMGFLRAAFVLGAALTVTARTTPDYAVGGIFAVAELLLFPCLLAAVRSGRSLAARNAGPVESWWRRHFSFGGRGLVNGILLETHLRVDTAMLSYFLLDADVGAYAFAALFAEGLYQIPVVIRTVAFPKIVQLAHRGDLAGVAFLARRLALASGLICASIAAAIGIVYPHVAMHFDPTFTQIGPPVLGVLLAGITFYGLFAPVDQILLQSGFPGRQSLLTSLYVGVNIALNAALIPRFGLIGAAYATAGALSIGGILLLAASRIWLGYRPAILFHPAAA